MTNVFVIHGAYGGPKENWIPWLKGQLEKLDCRVIVPKFPTPENQTLDNWMKLFAKNWKYLDEDSIMVGHSLGVTFILRVLEKLRNPIKACFLVAGVLSQIGIEKFDSINKTFFAGGFDTKKIKQNCKRIYVINSDNDPYIPLEKAEELAKNLNVEIILVKNADHFNEKAGYTKFELLLEKIKKEL